MQLGPLGDGEGERELGSLAAGELSGALGRIEADLADATPGHLNVPARVEPRAQAQVIGDRQPGVGRRVLGHEPHLPDLPGVICRLAAEDLDHARRRPQ